MKSLLIDTQSDAWRQIAEYVKDRTATLIEECVNVSSTDDVRRQAAARIDELRSLLAAPGKARQHGLQQTEARSTY